MGGIWQSVVYGFGGVRIVGQELHIAPRLLPEWSALSFPLVWRGQPLAVQADQAGVCVTAQGSQPITVRVYGQAVTLEPGKPRRMQKPAEA